MQSDVVVMTDESFNHSWCIVKGKRDAQDLVRVWLSVMSIALRGAIVPLILHVLFNGRRPSEGFSLGAKLLATISNPFGEE